MAQLPCLAALDARGAEPTGKVLGFGRNKGQTTREELEKLLQYLMAAFVQSKMTVDVANSKRKKYIPMIGKYTDEDVNAITDTLKLACVRTNALRNMIIGLQEDLYGEEGVEEDLKDEVCGNKDHPYQEFLGDVAVANEAEAEAAVQQRVDAALAKQAQEMKREQQLRLEGASKMGLTVKQYLKALKDEDDDDVPMGFVVA